MQNLNNKELTMQEAQDYISRIERLKVSLNPLLKNDLIVENITPQATIRFNRSPLI